MVRVSAACRFAISRFDLGARAGAKCAGTVQEIGVARLRILDRGHAAFHPVVGTALQNEVALRQVLQPFGKRLAAIEHLGDGRGIGARQLEETMGADGENRRAHRGRVLVEKLVCGDDADPELARFREHRLHVA